MWFLFVTSSVQSKVLLINCFMVAAPPSVSNVQILGDLVEGSTIRGVGDYFGGREGPSKFEWLCERSNTGSVYSNLVMLKQNENMFS